MDRKIKPWLLEPPRAYVFTNANVIDVRDGVVQANSTIRLAGGRILSVSPASSSSSSAKPTSASEADADAQTVDLAGKFVIPGLIDSHVHLAMTPGEPDPKSTLEVDEHTALLRMTYVCRSILSRGFTTVRDCGGAPMALRTATQEWLVPGPRLVLCGHALTMTGGHGDFRSMNDHAEPECPSCGQVKGMTRLCDGVDACLKNTRDELRRGADFIKVLGSGGMFRPGDSLARVQFMPEEVSTVAEVARAAGTYVTAHAYTPEAIRHAVRNGARGIEHGNFLDAATAEYLAEKGVYLTPTLAAFDAALWSLASQSSPLATMQKEKHQKALDAGLEAMVIAKKAGVTMCLGTDLLGGAHMFQSREFGLRARVLSPLDILQSATINPARMMGLEDTVGQVREGFSADLLVLRSNPLDDITVLERVKSELLAVFKDGRAAFSQLDGVEPLLK